MDCDFEDGRNPLLTEENEKDEIKEINLSNLET